MLAAHGDIYKLQLQNQLRQVDFLISRYQSSGDKTQLLATVKLQAQIIDSLLQAGGMAKHFAWSPTESRLK